MTYSRNAIYTQIVNAIRAGYPNAYCTSRMVASPAKFPACLIHEIDNSRPIQNTQLDFQDVQYESVYKSKLSATKQTQPRQKPTASWLWLMRHLVDCITEDSNRRMLTRAIRSRLSVDTAE